MSFRVERGISLFAWGCAVREIAALAALAQKDMGPKNRLGDFWKGGLTLVPNEGYLRVSRRA